MSSFGEELRRLMDRAGLTQVQLAEKMGVGQPFVSKLVRGEKEKIGAEVLYPMCAALGVPADHFAPYLAPGATVPPPPVPVVSVPSAGVDLPIIGWVEAGGGVDDKDETAETLTVPAKWVKADGVLRVLGASMLGAGIHPADYLIVKRNADPPDGSLAIAWKKDRGAVVKRCVRKGHLLFLRSEADDNAAADALIPMREGDYFVGVVLAVYREVDAPPAKPKGKPAAKKNR